MAAAAADAAAARHSHALSACIPALASLLDHLTSLAVHHDRARGDSWPVIAARLNLEPETARRRHRSTPRQASAATDPDGSASHGGVRHEHG
ncbi:hypothetical protein [Yinghuangia soli]|uniref:Uncharacterized protein n=1 Tax=Yinghuangia soli TaxID=2908204 RepID=A0AA41U502_9ACTN|nr:hypothetical protein [Yinghuangia soli]MCF2533521.1 hypothetical protein [Yinghuangia soli]